MALLEYFTLKYRISMVHVMSVPRILNMVMVATLLCCNIFSDRVSMATQKRVGNKNGLKCVARNGTERSKIPMDCRPPRYRYKTDAPF